ncbi:MFS transporter [Kitasatospora sp. NPDC089797]|uniref:MFS transporter n=1 Tax=Kitasatospora sp. NPDC089797 TaxID=3155298 RepID=UPI0034374AC0
MSATTEHAGPGQDDPRRWTVLAVLSGSLLIISMDTTILNVAFPSIVEDLRPGAVEQLWIVDSYALALSGLLITAGALGDRWGRKRLLLVGFGIFALASLLAVFAVAPWQLIAARALLGVGGAAIMPSTLSILRHTFSDPGERAFAYAVWAAVFGAGMALGPVIGGLLIQAYGWHSAFLVNLPIAAAVLVLGSWLLPESRSAAVGTGWDWWGVGQSIVGMVALAAGIKELGHNGVSEPLSWVLLAVAALSLTVFVRRQLRLANPLLQVRLFTRPAFSVAAVAILLAMIGMGAVLFLVTQWLQFSEGHSPFQAGVRLLPAPIALILASVATPALMRSLPIRFVLAAGMTVMAAGLALPWILQRSTEIGYPAFALSLALLGLGAGVATTVASVTMMALTPPDEVGGAAAIEETGYELGAAFGVAIIGSLASALYRSDLDVTRLDPGAARTARDSVAEAARIAGELGGESGALLLRSAAHAYTEAITPAFLTAACLALAAALAALLWIPHDLRPTERTH